MPLLEDFIEAWVPLVQSTAVNSAPSHVARDLMQEFLCPYDIRRLLGHSLFRHLFGHTLHRFGLLGVELAEDLLDRVQDILVVL